MRFIISRRLRGARRAFLPSRTPVRVRRSAAMLLLLLRPRGISDHELPPAFARRRNPPSISFPLSFSSPLPSHAHPGVEDLSFSLSLSFSPSFSVSRLLSHPLNLSQSPSSPLFSLFLARTLTLSTSLTLSLSLPLTLSLSLTLSVTLSLSRLLALALPLSYARFFSPLMLARIYLAL